MSDVSGRAAGPAPADGASRSAAEPATGAAELAAAERRWRESLDAARRTHPERPASFESGSGLPLEPLYTPSSLSGTESERYLERLGFPGEHPYTRGVHPTMYRGRLWTMRQYAGYASAEESNRRYRYLLERGQSGLSVAFDLPTQLGYDADHPLAAGEVGKVGVAVCSVEDLERLFAGIPLGRVSTSMTINATAPILLAMHVAVARRQGVPAAQLAGTVQNDILKEYVARGTYIYPPAASLRLAVDVIEYCSRELPLWNSISISGYHLREAGATAVQELAFTLADGLTYVEAAQRRGLALDAFAPRLSFFFSADRDLFEEVAKFRAARRLWARLLRERLGARDPRSWALRCHVQTAGSTLTAQQPLNNVVRTTLEALAAVLGGCQSLHTNSLDEALGLPSEEAARLALRTQQILAHESGVASVVDPLGGSYYVEALTDRLEAEAEAYLARIDERGGVLRCVESGYLQREIHEAAYRQQRRIESGAAQVVGVNCFVEPGAATPVAALRVDPGVAAAQTARLAELRARRDRAAVETALAGLRRAAAGDANVLPAILGCVEALATLGEIADALRDVFGEHAPGGGL